MHRLPRLGAVLVLVGLPASVTYAQERIPIPPPLMAFLQQFDEHVQSEVAKTEADIIANVLPNILRQHTVIFTDLFAEYRRIRDDYRTVREDRQNVELPSVFITRLFWSLDILARLTLQRPNLRIAALRAGHDSTAGAWAVSLFMEAAAMRARGVSRQEFESTITASQERLWARHADLVAEYRRRYRDIVRSWTTDRANVCSMYQSVIQRIDQLGPRADEMQDLGYLRRLPEMRDRNLLTDFTRTMSLPFASALDDRPQAGPEPRPSPLHPGGVKVREAPATETMEREMAANPVENCRSVAVTAASGGFGGGRKRPPR